LVNDILFLIPALPLAGTIINGLIGHRLPRPVPGLLACLAVLGSAAISVMGLLQIYYQPEGYERVVQQTLFTWIASGSLNTSVGFLLDPLSAVMACVVTVVGFLIHVYSLGYMAHDPRYHRFFTYMNLFTFSMLMLVLADSFLLMFVGWEGVGLCSYLLIGFWFDRDSAAQAGKKAFLVNRVGDFGFLLAMIFIFAVFGSLDYADVFARVAAEPGAITGTLTVICLLLFVGATGKSAQIPLYVWLPDAMEGPTPVSALIHAATMVTAGVYMVARCSIMFVNAPLALLVVAVIGALTALFAATIGLVQNDIKRVLAYSTVSQLGYMFMACGVGAFAAAIFHLMTHAFFKALLFLGAGSVIHGMHEEQDIRKMGGLKKWMPITWLTFLMGTLAISGIPIWSGFFSKDEIIWSSLAGPMGHWAFWAVGVVTAVLTAFYMARLTFKTFLGQPRMDEHTKSRIHESPLSMTLVLVLLAFGATFAGLLNVPKGLAEKLHIAPHATEVFAHFLEPSIVPKDEAFGLIKHAAITPQVGFVHLGTHVDHALEIPLMVGTVVLALLALAVGYSWYVRKPGTATALAAGMPGLYRTLLNKYYVDEAYRAIIIRPGMAFSTFLWRGFDVLVVDGIVNTLAWTVGILSRLFRVAQTGYVRSYAAGILAGAVFIIWVLTR